MSIETNNHVWWDVDMEAIIHCILSMTFLLFSSMAFPIGQLDPMAATLSSGSGIVTSIVDEAVSWGGSFKVI